MKRSKFIKNSHRPKIDFCPKCNMRMNGSNCVRCEEEAVDRMGRRVVGETPEGDPILSPFSREAGVLPASIIADRIRGVLSDSMLAEIQQTQQIRNATEQIIRDYGLPVNPFGWPSLNDEEPT